MLTINSLHVTQRDIQQMTQDNVSKSLQHASWRYAGTIWIVTCTASSSFNHIAQPVPAFENTLILADI
jgi:hypothetical protein